MKRPTLEAKRVVWRVRDKVTGGWKLRDLVTGAPDDFATREAARSAARYVKRWRIVKVTIRSRK